MRLVSSTYTTTASKLSRGYSNYVFWQHPGYLIEEVTRANSELSKFRGKAVLAYCRRVIGI